MPSLKDLRNRISSVTATRKITHAMQLVSAAKLRQARLSVEHSRPYSGYLGAILRNLSRDVANSGNEPPLLKGTGRDEVHLLLVCTTERGLCGALNSNIVRLACQHASQLLGEGRKIEISCIGRKGYEQMARRFPKVVIKELNPVNIGSIDVPVMPLARCGTGLQAGDSAAQCSGSDETDAVHIKSPNSDPLVKKTSPAFNFSFAQAVSDRVIRLFNEGSFDVCTLFFSQFHSVILQTPTVHRLIPLSLDEIDSQDEVSFRSAGDGGEAIYLHEPEDVDLLSSLLQRNIAVQVFKAILENGASEQGARMTAMDNATRNAGDVVDKLTLKYNRQRQAQITKELIEVVSGAEAL